MKKTIHRCPKCGQVIHPKRAEAAQRSNPVALALMAAAVVLLFVLLFAVPIGGW